MILMHLVHLRFESIISTQNKHLCAKNRQKHCTVNNCFNITIMEPSDRNGKRPFSVSKSLWAISRKNRLGSGFGLAVIGLIVFLALMAIMMQSKNLSQFVDTQDDEIFGFLRPSGDKQGNFYRECK